MLSSSPSARPVSLELFALVRVITTVRVWRNVDFVTGTESLALQQHGESGYVHPRQLCEKIQADEIQRGLTGSMSGQISPSNAEFEDLLARAGARCHAFDRNCSEQSKQQESSSENGKS